MSEKKVHHWELYVDGAARNNPGPAGAGLYLLKDGVPVEKHGIYLGSKTNNQAEYLALLLGALYARHHMKEGDSLVIKADSELLVRQMNGIYRVRNHELSRLNDAIRTILDGIMYKVTHIRRELNAIADKLANAGIDKKMAVPQEISVLYEEAL